MSCFGQNFAAFIDGEIGGLRHALNGPSHGD
jgi:hypothetical protein